MILDIFLKYSLLKMIVLLVRERNEKNSGENETKNILEVEVQWNIWRYRYRYRYSFQTSEKWIKSCDTDQLTSQKVWKWIKVQRKIFCMSFYCFLQERNLMRYVKIC